MLATEQEAPAEATGSRSRRRFDGDTAHAGDLARLRWGLRAGGVIVGIIGAAILSLAHAAGLGWEFHALNGSIFAAFILMAYALAIISRRTHVEHDQRQQAQLLTGASESQEEATRDYLTQLFDRGYFFERFKRELDRARRLRTPVAVLVMDVDRLDAINDACGQKAGDVALTKLAKVILKCTRSSDVPARLGGDEFGIIMPETDRRGAFVVATRIRRSLETTPVYERDGHSIMLSVSLGVSGFPWDGEDGDELVQKADACMHVVKSSRHGNTDTTECAPSESSLAG